VPACSVLLYEPGREQAWHTLDVSHPSWERERTDFSHQLPAATRLDLIRHSATQVQSGLSEGPSRVMSYFSKSAAITSRSGCAPREIGPNSS
jgi:hypothetical protein